MVQILLLNYQPNYNSNSQFQYQGLRNKLMFTQRGKMGMMMVKQKTINKKPEEILTTSPAIILEKKVTMWETYNAIQRQNSTRMQKHSLK